MRQLSFEDWEFTRTVRLQQSGFGTITNVRLAQVQMTQARQIIVQRGQRGQQRHARTSRGKESAGDGETESV